MSDERIQTAPLPGRSYRALQVGHDFKHGPGASSVERHERHSKESVARWHALVALPRSPDAGALSNVARLASRMGDGGMTANTLRFVRRLLAPEFTD